MIVQADKQSRSQFAINSTHCNELIEKLQTSADPQLLESFFIGRLKWCSGYPLVHDRLVTYGAFDDLTSKLTSNIRHQLVPKALEITETAPDQHFHAALFFLADMIPDDAMYERPSGFSDSLLRMRLRAEKLTFLPNLTCAWESFVRKSYYLRMEEDDFLKGYTPKEFAISSEAWCRFFPSPLINHAVSSLNKCKADPGYLKLRFKELGAKTGERRLVYATRIKETWYWVWKILGSEGAAHLARLVFLRQPVSGAIRIGYWDIYRQFTERHKPAEITRRLLKIEFYPNDDLREVQPAANAGNMVYSLPDIEVVFVQLDATNERDISCAEMLSRVVKKYQGVRLTVIDCQKASSMESQRIIDFRIVSLPKLIIVKDGQFFSSVGRYNDENSFSTSLELALG